MGMTIFAKGDGMSAADNKQDGWVSPKVQKFGTQQGAAKTASANVGAECGDSVLRYGPECGIRTGNKCQPRNPAQCTPIQFGVSCNDRQGVPCKDFDSDTIEPDPSAPSL